MESGQNLFTLTEQARQKAHQMREDAMKAGVRGEAYPEYIKAYSGKVVASFMETYEAGRAIYHRQIQSMRL